MAAKWKGPKPEKFAFVIEKRMNALLSQAVLHTDTMLKQESPVDKGRFQNSWQIGENGTGEYDGGEGLGEAPPVGMNYNVGNEKIGNSYTIHNSLPYAEALAAGHSKQASPGWVQQIAKDMQGWIQINAKRIGKDSV
tara:strand:+ start:890 stop:1300 length:411 start_codon:yes stop_codon:yes gene_type:complete